MIIQTLLVELELAVAIRSIATKEILYGYPYCIFDLILVIRNTTHFRSAVSMTAEDKQPQQNTLLIYPILYMRPMCRWLTPPRHPPPALGADLHSVHRIHGTILQTHQGDGWG